MSTTEQGVHNREVTARDPKKKDATHAGSNEENFQNETKELTAL